jgi:hypothetical protein
VEAEFLVGLESRAPCKIERQRSLNGFYKQFTPSLRQTNDPRPQRGLNGHAGESEIANRTLVITPFGAATAVLDGTASTPVQPESDCARKQ